jgi:hypothetical protein
MATRGLRARTRPPSLPCAILPDHPELFIYLFSGHRNRHRGRSCGYRAPYFLTTLNYLFIYFQVTETATEIVAAATVRHIS